MRLEPGTLLQPGRLRPGFDTVERHALLGLACVEAPTGRMVSQGLALEVEDLRRPQRRTALQRNASGLFVLHALPGRSGFGGDPSGPVAAPEPAGSHRLHLRDAQGRYLPLQCALTLPPPGQPASGLWQPPGDAARPQPGAGAALPGLPLFPGPAWQPPAGWVQVRAELRAAGDPRRPLPWAWVELRLAGTLLATAPADERGRVLLAAPMPRPPEGPASGPPPIASPPDTDPGAAAEPWTWTVTLHARWSPAQRPGVAPDLATLASQPAVALLQRAGPALPLPPQVLAAREPLVVRSDGAAHLLAQV
jgi:hypothetical protein